VFTRTGKVFAQERQASKGINSYLGERCLDGLCKQGERQKQSVSAKWWKTLRGFPPYAVAAICRVDNAKLVHLDDQITNGSKHRCTLFAFQSAIAQTHQPPRSAGRAE
jgi:hypothetical protein